jgi:branched-chain amino acid transport system permease protein
MLELQTLLFGIVTSSYLIVATLGFALVSRVERFLNIAHAEFITLGAFTTYFLTASFGWNLALAGAVAMALVACVSLLLARLVYSPIRRSGETTLLITSVGVMYLLQGIIETSVEPGVHSYDVPAEKSIEFWSLRLGYYDIAIVVLALAGVLAVHLVLTRTSIGLQWRALASDDGLAASRGINVRSASSVLWLMSGALAGLAGVLLGLQGTITTDVAFEQILLILSVSILAGVGSIYGVVFAALILGVAMDMSTLIIPAGYREAVAFAVVLIALVFRPDGLSGAGTARREA